MNHLNKPAGQPAASVESRPYDVEITSIAYLNQTGKALANNFLDHLERYACTHYGDALYHLVDSLTLQICHADQVKLKALLNRIQKQLKAQR